MGHPYDRLQVLDRLEVGPVQLKPHRLAATYRVRRGSFEAQHELVYRWEEPVFDPDDPASVELASLIAVQPALNYGLFCRELRLRGPFDAADRRFLGRMLENTSREILVNKILIENPFLREEVQGLAAEPRERYTAADVTWDGEPTPSLGGWDASPDRWLVLSSGGKDSLLSFGLLRELGEEVHPVFVNESGRHWLTALNAHRAFRDGVPHTTRVWTSVDRLFSFMLRQLPFVRPDFHRRRADIYPLRLWTVAVFLFGALPIARKRRLGWLVVGDEHDTSVRATHAGIPHYAGLYDQSLWFDRALTRFYHEKGWGVGQVSLLRSLSELLIEKTLVARYPDLARLQVSCHAARHAGARVVPCGRCEKCHRIVAMLLAVGADPDLCGYEPAAVAAVLQHLPERGLHQERPGVEHLAYRLGERGLLDPPRIGAVTGRKRPEVESLRFHRDRSPEDGVPARIRPKLYGVLLDHAAGAVIRRDRKWVAHEVATEAPGPIGPEGTVGPGGTTQWGELTWPLAVEALAQVDIALLPVGAVEQHGPHLPLDTDAFDAELLAARVAEACSVPKPLVLPLVPYGVSYQHEDFAGTLSVSNETLARFVYEIGMSAAKNGVKKLVIVNGHGGNGPTLHFAAQMINRDASIFTCVESGETSDAEVEAITDTPNDVHAGEVETSTSLAVRPHLVRLAGAEPFVPVFSSRYLDFTSHHSVGWYARTARISPQGVFGDPSRASAEKGHRIWALWVRHLVELVEHLRSLSLDEIYERRT